MGLFGRSRGKAQDEPENEPVADGSSAVTPVDTHDASPGDSAVGLVEEEASTDSGRPDGPWDETEDYPELPRVDLGSLRIPQHEKIRIQVQADPTSGAVSQLTLLIEGSAVQIQPYAAPRSGGMWNDIRQQIISSINASGGLVEQQEGHYGTEVRAQVANAEGKAQPARFCGIDGPRWFVRLVFLGKAARDESAADLLNATVQGMVVVRGNEAMPMGNSLPLRVPATDQVATDESPTAPSPERPTMTLPARGPEITETR